MSMQICFLSNYFNHHQKPLSDALFRLTGGNYYFIATGEVSVWRKDLGYSELSAPYVLHYDLDKRDSTIDRIINESDIVIIGAADKAMVHSRLKQGKLTYLCTERIYWKKVPWYRLISHYLKFGLWYRRFSNLFLLCASAYTSEDFLKTGTFKDKAFKWGYFPDKLHYDVDALIDKKEQLNELNGCISILWVGRLIEWKHPDSCIALALWLKEKRCQFRISIIGVGEMSSELKVSVNSCGLTKEIVFLDSMSPESVRHHMEESSIFIFTSDEQEGWGAVLNEAMNSACAVVASKAVGSAPYLIRHGFNGLLFDSLDWNELSNHVEALINNPAQRRELSLNAYHTIVNEWNAENASERLIVLSNDLINGTSHSFSSGPCSIA